MADGSRNITRVVASAVGTDFLSPGEGRGGRGERRGEGVLCAVCCPLDSTALSTSFALPGRVWDSWGFYPSFGPSLGSVSRLARPLPLTLPAGWFWFCTRRGGLQSRYYVCARCTQSESRPDIDSRDEHETRPGCISQLVGLMVSYSAPAAVVLLA